MKTEKTRGDILADKIEAWLNSRSFIEDLEKILAEYRKPEWTLGRSVNGHALRDGQEWHRQDWTEDMLPDGWRPLLLDEQRHPSDEIYGFVGNGPWTKYANSDTAYSSAESNAIHSRTRRPLPVLVQLGPEDVKCGDEIKVIPSNQDRLAIMEITPLGVYSRRTFHTWGELQEFCVINRNDGKGFVRCEKEAK